MDNNRDLLDLENFKELILRLGEKENNKNNKYEELSKKIVNNLNDTFNPNRQEQQNILDSRMKQRIIDMITSNLPEKFDYHRHTFAEIVINEINKENTLN